MDKQESPTMSSLRLMIVAPDTTQSNTSSILTESNTLAKPLANLSPFPTFLKSLTGIEPLPETKGYSGYTSHPPLLLKTRYYASNVSLWCDELPSLEEAKKNSAGEEAQPTLSEWKDQMLSEEAREVREVIGGLILLLPYEPSSSISGPAKEAYLQSCLSYLEIANTLRERIEDETGRDVAAIAVAQETTAGDVLQAVMEDLEDRALSDRGMLGWDYVMLKHNDTSTSQNESQQSTTQADARQNEFGESTGVPRIVEVLGGIDWSLSLDQSNDEQDLDFLASEEDFFDESMFDRDIPVPDRPGLRPNVSIGEQQRRSSDKDPVTQQSHEFQQEIMGLKLALEKHERSGDDDDSSEEIDVSGRHDRQGDEDMKVEQLADMLGRVVAIKEAASEMSSAERQKFAKREVAKIMREMG